MENLTLTEKEKQLFDNFDDAFAKYAEGDERLEALSKIRISEIAIVDNELN